MKPYFQYNYPNLTKGQSRTQVAKFLKVSRTSVNKWVHTFLEEDLEGLQEKPRTGRPSFLTPEQQEQLWLRLPKPRDR
ncbi:helix-turn-helix domain-containing protein [Photobacterium galatheae]|uniref:helix-turn-helix domain-containing protein n=2 Tax=Photobacterium galatheae TaxID=1654360 RepID=UPI00126920D6